MKIIINLTFLTILCVQTAMAGGSISWEDVKSKIAKSDPEIVKVIENTFTVNQSGGGRRLGPHFGERHGERISPFEFGAVEKKTKEKCILVIEESEDYEFTGRFKFVKKSDENDKQEAGTGQSSSRPVVESESGGKP